MAKKETNEQEQKPNTSVDLGHAVVSFDFKGTLNEKQKAEFTGKATKTLREMLNDIA